jgi:hypothetical protein
MYILKDYKKLPTYTFSGIHPKSDGILTIMNCTTEKLLVDVPYTEYESEIIAGLFHVCDRVYAYKYTDADWKALEYIEDVKCTMLPNEVKLGSCFDEKTCNIEFPFTMCRVNGLENTFIITNAICRTTNDNIIVTMQNASSNFTIMSIFKFLQYVVSLYPESTNSGVVTIYSAIKSTFYYKLEIEVTDKLLRYVTKVKVLSN